MLLSYLRLLTYPVRSFVQVRILDILTPMLHTPPDWHLSLKYQLNTYLEA